MGTKNVQGVALDICQNCGGIWFDSDELRTLLAQDPHAFTQIEQIAVPLVEQKAADPTRLRCPIDGNPLREYHYLYDSPVSLETCDACGGFFIQEGELDKMQQFLDASHQPLTPQEQIAADMAQEVANHARDMARIQNATTMFQAFRVNQPGWFGLF